MVLVDMCHQHCRQVGEIVEVTREDAWIHEQSLALVFYEEAAMPELSEPHAGTVSAGAATSNRLIGRRGPIGIANSSRTTQRRSEARILTPPESLGSPHEVLAERHLARVFGDLDVDWLRAGGHRRLRLRGHHSVRDRVIPDGQLRPVALRTDGSSSLRRGCRLRAGQRALVRLVRLVACAWARGLRDP